jgi:hypothetical protein
MVMKGLLLAAAVMVAAADALATDLILDGAAIPTPVALPPYNWFYLGSIATMPDQYNEVGFSFVRGGFNFQSGAFALAFQADVSFDEDKQTFYGWAGVKMALDEQWSLKAEYLHSDGSLVTFSPNLVSPRFSDPEVDIVKLGVSYKFD